MKTLHILILLIGITWAGTAHGKRTPIQNISAEPYRSAIVLNAETGEVLFEKNADAKIYPASTLKLMVLLVILENIEQGSVKLEDMVQVTVEAYKMGGSQVYLDPKEQFSVEDLLYALMIQSANDAAVALASHIAGSRAGFVALMNQKAQELGMNNTTFYSVHGLPPSGGKKVDVSSARDFGILCRYMSGKPEVFPYTSTKVRDFREGKFIMRTHNHLLKTVAGCDGFKTGYFIKAGFSIAATAQRDGVRIIVVVMGSKNRKVRDAKAIELLATGFLKVPPKQQAAPAAPVSVVLKEEHQETEISTSISKTTEQLQEKAETGGWGKFFVGLGLGFLLYAVLDFVRTSRRRKRSWKSRM